MDQLQGLVARDQIHQLADRYAVAVDAKDLDGLARLFVEDVDNGRYGRGREGLKLFYDHVVSNHVHGAMEVTEHVIDFIDDDHAEGVVYCRAHHHVVEPEHWFDLSLAYWDTYQRVGDRWFFSRRRLKSWYRQEFGHPSHGSERVVASSGDQGPTRGMRMPEAFATFQPFWDRPAAPAPPTD